MRSPFVRRSTLGKALQERDVARVAAERLQTKAAKQAARASRKAERKDQPVTNAKHQVRADFDADSGLVEVFPHDPERTAFFLGVRPDVGGGGFVRLTAAEAVAVAERLAPALRASSGTGDGA